MKADMTNGVAIADPDIHDLDNVTFKASNGSLPPPQATAKVSLPAQHGLVLKTIRLLVADLCQQFGGGHGG
jgi:dihydroxyacetone synthase